MEKAQDRGLRNRRRAAALGLCAWLPLALPVSADSLYWEGVQTAQNTYEIWATAANWDTLAEGTGGAPATAPTTGDTAVFNTTVNNGTRGARLSANRSIDGLVFNNTGTTAICSETSARKTLTIGAGGVTVNSGAGAVSFGTGSRPLAVSLGTSQTWVNHSANALSSVGGTSRLLLSTYTLTVDGSGNTTFTGDTLSGTAATAVIKNGTGTLTFDVPSASFTGDVQINGGTVRYGVGSALPGTADVLFNTASGTATLDLNNFSGTNATLTLGGASGTVAAVTTGTGTLTLGGNVTYDAANNPNGATIGGNLNLGDATRTFTIGDSTVAASDLTLGAVISSASGGALAKEGTGTLTLTNANTYTGDTALNAGTLTLNAPGTGSTLSSPLVTVKSAATLVIAGAGSALGDATDVAIEAGGLMDVRTSDTLGGLSGAGIVRLTSTRPCILTVNSGNESTVFSGKLENTGGGALGLTKAGSGSLTLSGTNTTSGATVVSAGTLILTQAKALSTNSAVSVAAGAMLDLNFAGTVTVKSLTVDGVLMAPNTLYSSANLPEALSGSGSLLASEGRIEIPFASSGRWVLRSGKKADRWQDAFVTGNGSHGMMVMGESLSERIINVHEELFLRAWDRSIVGVPYIADHLAEQRQLIAAGSNNAAFFVYGDAINQANAAGAGATWELTPHPAFDLRIDHLNPGGLLSYTNELDLETGEARCQWQRSNTAVDQRAFSSRSNNVNVVSLRATAGGKLNLTLALSETPGRSGLFMDTFDLDNAFSSVTTNAEPGWLSYKASYTVDRGGYEGLARVTLVGGSMVKTGTGLTITNASEVLVLIRISPLADGATSVEAAVKAELAALSIDYGQLLQPHALKHREMLGRVTLDLGASNAWKTETTQEMLQDVAANGPSAHYLEAAHVMGRYLLISSCGRYPPPLRGIWGGDWKADWAGGFVLDSNLDLAMSAAGPGNLPECIQSYAGYIDRQLPGWRTNAFNTFGARGFMAASFGSPETGYQSHKNPAHWYYVCQAGWTLRPLYDYALLSKDDTFMEARVLPLYREMADFYADFMVQDGNGKFHITPGCSPESNTPAPYDSQMADDCTIDLAVAREVYQVLIEQGPKFGIPPAQISAWEIIRTNITPYRIDANGSLAEWAPSKYTVVNYGSRHNSHLYPIFPGYEFFQSGSSSQLLQAARVALQKRIETEHLQLYDELSGHGIMYAAMMSARLRETMNVNKLLNHISRNGFRYDSMFSSHCPNGRYYNMDVAGSYPRLLMEMLVFSHPGNIDLMPGWNAELPSGSCTGLLVRGGHSLDLAWTGGAMTSAVLHAGANETLTVRFGAQSNSLAVVSGQQYQLKTLFTGDLKLASTLTLGLSNPSGNGCSPTETVEKSVDSNNGTKWCCAHGGKPVIWQMAYASPPAQALRGYSFTSANDVPGRDPISWTLEGSHDGVNWTVLDERNLGAPFASRYMKKNFGIGNTVSFKVYRFVFQPSSTETLFQVAEIALDFSGANYASNYSPANNAVGVSVTPTLSWTAGSGATRHDVYFGTSQSAVQIATTASPEYKGRQTTASYAPGALSAGTAYYWRIDETISAGTPVYSGYALRFTTAGSPPPVVPVRALPELAGKSVALWSKFTGRFVRSPGVAGGTLFADRDAYDANFGEGRFLCAAEAGGTVAFLDLLLQQYVTVVSGPLVSTPAGTPESRRFTLEAQGNAYYAIRASNGFYVRAGLSGDLAADAALLTDEALFSIVPIRDGPNVVMRAYNGDDPQNQISDTIPNEVALFCDNPADFPVNKVNIGTLQMTAGLSSDQQLLEMRQVWNNKNFEDESIIPYSITTPLTNQLDSIVNSIKRIESLGYAYDYIILYHEILADLPGGPWSDPRISSPEEISLLRERILLGYNRGDLKHPSYKIFCMPYQFQPSLMGIPPFENTPVGCDAAALAFIKQNFDGLFLEVNGHDYLSRNEHVDAALAAAWCRTNGLEFGITSGLATSKDTVYKSMYQDIFDEMAAVGFDKSWSGMHYILHHVFQQYPDRLPEWVENTTTDNSRWLIEQVMPYEAWSLSARDTDGDGTSDEDEIRAGTFPFGPGGLLLRPDALAYDDVYGYTDGALSGQAGVPVGFGGVWTSSGASVDAAARTVTQTNGSYRSYRSFTPAPLTNAGTVQVRATLALAANNNFSALELATTAGSDAGSVRLASDSSSLRVTVVGTGGASSPVLAANDGQTHQWLLELNLVTRAGRVWLDAAPSIAPGAAFTLPTGFQLNALNLATFALGQPGTPSLQLQEILILPGAVVIAEPEPTPGLTVVPALLTSVCRQSENALPQQFTVQSSSWLPAGFTLSDNASWLLTPAAGTAFQGLPTPVQVTYDTSLLAPGTYTATITLASADVTNSPQTVAVTLTVAADRTWSGSGGDNSWTTGPNWGGTAPNQYDSLIFAGSTRTSNSNTLAPDISVGNLSFDAAASAFTLSGNRLTLLGNIGFLGEPSTAVTQTINLDMILSADSMVTAPSNGVIAINGIVSGAHKLTKAGTGALTLAGANSHSGGTEFGAGTLNINNASALGSGTFTLAGATLDNSTAAALTNTQNNAIAWNANVTFLGTKSLDLGTGNVFLDATRVVTVNANTLTLGGAIGDGGNNYGLTKDGAGALTLNGPSTYTGTTAVRAGTLNAATLADNNASSLGLGSIVWLGYRTTTGTLNYTGAGETTARTLQMGYGNQSTYRGGATLNANGANGGSGLVFAAPNFTVIQGNTGSAAYRLLTLGGSNTDPNQIAGVIADVNPGVTQTRLTKADAGRWILSGTNTYTGVTAVNGGTLLVNGSHVAAGAGAYTVLTNATLGGRGTIGSVVTINNGGTLAPGGTNAAASLTCNANVTLAANAVLHVNINGPAVETQVDQLAMAGNTLTISGATLDVKVGPGYAPRSNTAFVIASGFATLTGTFAGLPEGAEFQLEGAPVSFYVHYDTASSPQKIWLRTRNLKDGTVIHVL